MSPTTGLALLVGAVYLAVAMGVLAGEPWACLCPRNRCEFDYSSRRFVCPDCGQRWEVEDRHMTNGEARRARWRKARPWPGARWRPRRRWRYAAWCVAEGCRMAWREVWR